MSKRRVLAISPNLDQLRRIVANLERAGAEVDAVRSLDAIESEIIPHRYVFIDTDEGDVGLVDALVPRLRQKSHAAVVTPKAGAKLDPEKIVAELKARLANFKIPKRCFVLDELPRNTMGKVQKALLREQYKGLFTS